MLSATLSPLLEARNGRTGFLLAREVRVTRDIWDRLRGLLGRPRLDAGQGLFIVPCNGVHTVGMGYAIDVVFVDRAGRVVHAAEGVRPLRCIPWVRHAHAVLELPAGTIAASSTTRGDVVHFDRTRTDG